MVRVAGGEGLEMEVPLEGGLPSRPEDLYRLHRLCLRIFGLLARDVPAQAAALAGVAGSGLRKKQRQALARVLEEELPVLIALYALKWLEGHRRLGGRGLGELLRGLLLPCFSLSYGDLYDQPADPLQHVLSRVDWYLDGDKGEPLEAFLHYLAMVEEGPAELDSLRRHLEQELLPELERRLELAFRYEFS